MDAKTLAATDIHAYLRQHEEKDLLRFLTCGSVDDGKSTLIGRLLYDCKMIYEDQLAAVMKDSKTHGTTGGDFDPALLTDGLKAEREQGITIDVAYRYFSTDRRKFIIADTPGHEQYTRNMATGASNCNLAIILVDARHGVVTQTRRHSFIVSLLGIKHVVVAVNKMDLVDWSEEVFEKIRSDYNEFAARLQFTDLHFIPMAALHGDNVVERSPNIPWYDGPSLLHHLETVNISSDRNLIDLRFPVQYVIRPDLNFRGFAGSLASGVLRTGDEVMVVSSGRRSRIKSLLRSGEPVTEAAAPAAIVATLEDEIDASRGDLFVHPNNLPHTGTRLEAMLVWMHQDSARVGGSYLLKHTTNLLPATLETIRYKMDVNTLRKQEHDGPVPGLEMNEIGRAHLTLHRPLAFDSYRKNSSTGAFVLIDRLHNNTVAAGMILDRPTAAEPAPPADAPTSKNIRRETSLVDPAERAALVGQKAVTIWLTGLSGSGKSTIAQHLEKQLIAEGRLCFILDGDNMRHGLNRDLGFSAPDRTENIRRVAEVARLFNQAGVIVLTSFISPYRSDREAARAIIGEDAFLEVHVSTPLEVCEARDPKGLYQKARAGEIPQFTGISDPYEAPDHPFLEVPTQDLSLEESVARIRSALDQAGIFTPPTATLQAGG
jgi:bifunctional enzyme CysN/CysC